MHITVDLDACDAHGDCVIEAPEIFNLDDDAEVVTVLLADPPEDLRNKAFAASDACPQFAITVDG